MEFLSDISSFYLFFLSIPIGIFAVVLGGSMFLSIPVFQIIFPEMTMSAIIGNIRVGSVIRNAGAVMVLKEHIDWKKFISVLLVFVLGALLGAKLINSVSQIYILPAIIVAIIVTETSQWLAKRITKKIYYPMAFLVGVFGGIIGAGLMLLLVALLRIRIPHDKHIHEVRSIALLAELMISITAVIVFWWDGHLIWRVWLVWASGAVIGGYLGGLIIQHSRKLSPGIQKMALRTMFIFALAVSIYSLF